MQREAIGRRERVARELRRHAVTERADVSARRLRTASACAADTRPSSCRWCPVTPTSVGSGSVSKNACASSPSARVQIRHREARARRIRVDLARLVEHDRPRRARARRPRSASRARAAPASATNAAPGVTSRLSSVRSPTRVRRTAAPAPSKSRRRCDRVRASAAIMAPPALARRRSAARRAARRAARPARAARRTRCSRTPAPRRRRRSRRPCGSSIMTTTTSRGRLAGAKPAKIAACRVVAVAADTALLRRSRLAGDAVVAHGGAPARAARRHDGLHHLRERVRRRRRDHAVAARRLVEREHRHGSQTPSAAIAEYARASCSGVTATP